ncbi:MAG: poly(R)-hydroxyalkanoic acid synthase subunit PhaE [Desulfomonilia bacterium]|jgi:hypothetical protein
MNEGARPEADLHTALAHWLAAAGRLRMEKDDGQQTATEEAGQGEFPMEEAWLAMTRTLKTLIEALSGPGGLAALGRGTGLIPEITAALLASGMKGASIIHQHVAERLERIGSHAEDLYLDAAGRESLQLWSSLYQKELGRYFRIPQLGLGRFYQERLNETLDKFNIFTAALAELLHLLSRPFEKSAAALQEQIEEFIRTGGLPEDTEAYYRMWLKALEGHFMTLFQSDEYNESLRETMSALEDYLSARNRIFQDMLKSLPIPTRNEMDDLSREVYLLKRRIRTLEKAAGKHPRV